jgi:hypothetical protein
MVERYCPPDDVLCVEASGPLAPGTGGLGGVRKDVTRSGSLPAPPALRSQPYELSAAARSVNLRSRRRRKGAVSELASVDRAWMGQTDPVPATSRHSASGCTCWGSCDAFDAELRGADECEPRNGQAERRAAPARASR